MHSTTIQLWQAIGGLLAGAAVDILLLRWLTPTPEAWARLLAEQAYAGAHGQFMCIYDPLPFIHSRAFYAFLSAPATLYVAAATIGLVVAGYIASRWPERQGRRVVGDQVPDGGRQLRRNTGGEDNA